MADIWEYASRSDMVTFLALSLPNLHTNYGGWDTPLYVAVVYEYFELALPFDETLQLAVVGVHLLIYAETSRI